MDAYTKKNYFTTILQKNWTNSHKFCLQNYPNYREMCNRYQKEGFI